MICVFKAIPCCLLIYLKILEICLSKYLDLIRLILCHCLDLLGMPEANNKYMNNYDENK